MLPTGPNKKPESVQRSTSLYLVQHMTHKYRLAVAIAVLKNKPENTTIEQYIEQLREKIKENDDDFLCTNDFNIDDTDFNFGDDDFNCDDTDILMTNEVLENAKTIEIDIQNDVDNNSVNILENFEAIVNTIDPNSIEVEKSNAINAVEGFHGANISRSKDYLETNSRKEKSHTTVIVNETEMTSNGHNIPSETDSVIDILRTLRDIEDSMEVENATIFDNASQATYFESSTEAIDIRINTRTDDSSTFSAHEDYDMHTLNTGSGGKNTAEKPASFNERIIAKVTKNLNKDAAFNSKTNSSIKDVNKTFNEVNNTNTKSAKTEHVTNSNAQSLEDDILRYDNRNASERLNNDLFKAKVDIVAKTINKVNRNDFHNLNKTDGDKERLFHTNIDENAPKATDHTTQKLTQDSQETIIYTLQGFTQNPGHISQSQCPNMDIPGRYLYGNKNRDITFVEKDNNTNKVEITNPNVKEFTNIDAIIQDRQITKVDSSQIQYIIDNTGKTYAVLQEIQLKNSQIGDFNDTNGHEEKRTNLEVLRTNQDLEGTQIDHPRTSIDYEELDIGNTFTNTESRIDNIDVDSSNSQQEIVPFKVVKELSKIKSYLNGKERVNTEVFSSDSGYRSDSQHSSYKSAHVSDNWVHQSAHCLFNYVLQCPLVVGTQDIVSEISLVFGRLIDRLHEEEKYPPFIEDLLTALDKLLNDLYHGGGCDNILLEKDEIIQRIFLLNKSSHILKYSIEKITHILEGIHTHLTSEETYELTNIQELENATYIFYVLEILLQKYMKFKSKSNSESQILSQNSQEGKIIKKSSIADIWRKKWNSKFKEVPMEGSQKMCVLVKCGEVLNRIIVGCIEGYSLIAFAALQCFNLLQS
ncbi:uncharacterized protein LOC126379394 [Pectinophora gossypiella]|nr:uncharacterized protein LOC126379394 [Pectinophora gossypiella]